MPHQLGQIDWKAESVVELERSLAGQRPANWELARGFIKQLETIR